MSSSNEPDGCLTVLALLILSLAAINSCSSLDSIQRDVQRIESRLK